MSSPIPGGQLQRQATSSTCLHLYQGDSSNVRRPHPPVVFTYTRGTAPTSGDLIHLSSPIPGGQLQRQATSSTCLHLYQEDSSNVRRPHPPVYTSTRRTAPTSGDLIHLSTPLPGGQLQHQATSSTRLHLYQEDSSNVRRPHPPVYTSTRRTAPTSGDLIHLSTPIPKGQLQRLAISSTCCLHLYQEDSSNVRRPHPPVYTSTRRTAPTSDDLIHLSSPTPGGQLQHQATSYTCLHLYQKDSSNIRRPHPPVYTYTRRTAPTSGDLIHLATPIPGGQLQHQATSSTCLHLYRRTASTSGDLIHLSTPIPEGQLQHQTTSSTCLHLYQKDSSNIRRPHPPVHTYTRRTAPTSGDLIHLSRPIPKGQLQHQATSSTCLHLYQKDSSNIRRPHPPVYTYKRRTATTSGDLIHPSTPIPGGQLQRQATSSTCCLHLYQEDSSNVRRPHPLVYTSTRGTASTSGDLIHLLSSPIPGGQLQRQATSSTCLHLYQEDSSSARRPHPPVYTYTKRAAPTSGDLIHLSTHIPGGQLQHQTTSPTCCLHLFQEDSSNVRWPHLPVYTYTRRTAPTSGDLIHLSSPIERGQLQR